MTRDELAIQLRPTSATERTAPEREPRTVIVRPVPQPPLVVPPAIYPLPARWVFDQQALTALVAFVLVAAFFLTVWLVVP